MKMKRSRIVAATMGAVLAIAASGCSSGGSAIATEVPKSAPTRDGLEQSVRLFYEGFKQGRPTDLYSFLSKSCRDAYGSTASFAGTIVMGRGMFEGFLGVKLSETRIGDVTIVDFAPDRATATSTIVKSDGSVLSSDDDPSPYVYEDGAWRSDDCSDVRSSGDSLGNDGKATGPGSRAEPIAIGDEAKVKTDDGTWAIKVVSVDTNANAAIKAIDRFNTDAPAGTKYVVVSMTATFTAGKKQSMTAFMGLDFSGVDASNTEVKKCSDLGVYNVGDDDSSREVFDGGSVTLLECFAVPSANVDSLVMSASAFFAFNNDSRVFMALH